MTTYHQNHKPISISEFDWMKMRRTFITISVALLVLLTAHLISAQTQNDQSDAPLDVATRTQVIEGVIKRFNDSYVFPEVAKAMEQSIRERLRKGEYDKITSASALAEALKAHLREVSKDTHIDVIFRNRPLPPMAESETEETAAEREQQRENLRRNYAFINNGIAKVERLKGNIGLLDLDMFVNPAFAGDTVTAAMGVLANTDALIVDLRYCSGGDNRMVALLETYLFAEPVHLSDFYQREANFTKQNWTLSYVPGPRYLDKEVYILTSKVTHSAAEAFAYELQSLKRATIVGEVSRGGAHTAARYRINEHFAVQVPVGRSINAITKTNWEGIGVLPDISIAADKSLKVAQLTALKHLLAKNPNQDRAGEIRELIESLEKEGSKPK